MGGGTNVFYLGYHGSGLVRIETSADLANGGTTTLFIWPEVIGPQPQQTQLFGKLCASTMLSKPEQAQLTMCF